MTEFGINKYACCICIRACMTIFKIRLFIITAVVFFKKKDYGTLLFQYLRRKASICKAFHGAASLN